MSMLESKFVRLEMNNTADIEELPSHIGLYKSTFAILQNCDNMITFVPFKLAVFCKKNQFHATYSEMNHCC